MVVDVLGTAYRVIESNEEKDKVLEGCDGYCDTSAKECVIDDMSSPEQPHKKNLPEYKKQVIRHELTHAFLHESGLDVCCDWARNEEIVDWLSIQIPKMIDTFRAADAL